MLSRISSHSLLQVGVELVEELIRGQPRMVEANQDREVPRHFPAFNGVDADLFEGFRETDDIGGVVERAAIPQAARPGEYRRDRIGRGLVALLMLAIVPGDCAMRRL